MKRSFKAFCDASFCNKTRDSKGAFFIEEERGEQVHIFNLNNIKGSEQAEYLTIRLGVEKICKVYKIKPLELNLLLFADCIPAIEKFKREMGKSYPNVEIQYLPGKYNPAHKYCNIK